MSVLENQRKSILSWWGVSELLDVVGSPGWTRTSDILINSLVRGANPSITSGSRDCRSRRIAACGATQAQPAW